MSIVGVMGSRIKAASASLSGGTGTQGGKDILGQVAPEDIRKKGKKGKEHHSTDDIGRVTKQPQQKMLVTKRQARRYPLCTVCMENGGKAKHPSVSFSLE